LTLHLHLDYIMFMLDRAFTDAYRYRHSSIGIIEEHQICCAIGVFNILIITV